MTAQLSPAQVAARLALADVLDGITDADYDHSNPLFDDRPCCAYAHAQRAGIAPLESSFFDVEADEYFGEGSCDSIFAGSALDFWEEDHPGMNPRTEVIARLRECVEVGS